MSRPRPVQPERNNGDRGKLGRGQLMFRGETASGVNSLHTTLVFCFGVVSAYRDGGSGKKKWGFLLCDLGQAALCLA